MLPLVYHDCYSDLVLPERHRYPIGKYRALYQHLLQAGIPDNWFDCHAAPATTAQLALVHQPEYIKALCQGALDDKSMRRIGFPWSEFLIKRSLQSVGGTIRTMQQALQHGIALHLSGGYHHAFAGEGAGFCLFNDLAVAAAVALQQGVDKVLIFDCDVHQGDGTALLFADEPRVVTASLHGEKNFPARKQHSDWDIGLPTQCQDVTYLDALHSSFDYLLRLHQPDLVLYDAGVDIHQDDDLGLLQISTNGVYQRDFFVLKRCHDLHTPVAAVIGGGYQRDINKLTQVHSQLFQAACAVYSPAQALNWTAQISSPDK